MSAGNFFSKSGIFCVDSCFSDRLTRAGYLADQEWRPAECSIRGLEECAKWGGLRITGGAWRLWMNSMYVLVLRLPGKKNVGDAGVFPRAAIVGSRE